MRDYHFARSLGERAALTYIFFADDNASPPDAGDLPFCTEIIPVRPPKTYSLGRIVGGIFGRWPLTVLNYTSAEMKAVITGAAASGPFDLVHLDHINLAGYAPLLNSELPQPRIIINWHNIESEAMRRFAASSSGAPWKKLYAAFTAHRLANLERRLLNTAFGHFVCSERERIKLHQLVPHARIAVIENGVDTESIAPTVSDRRNRLVFVGLMQYYANVDAVTWFARAVWPAIHSKFPHFRLTIVGANPTAPVLALRDCPGVEVTGTVPDIRPYYTDAFAAVVPLRTGGGTRLKILEAMAAGVPVISTMLGAEGLAVTPERDIIIADREQDWIAGLTALSKPERWRSVAAAGRALVCARYDWRILEDNLYRTCMEWIQST